MNTFKTILYMGTLHGFFTYYFPGRLAWLAGQPMDVGMFRFIAFPIWVVGTLIILRCSMDIVHKGNGTPAHLDPPKALIVEGLYRHVRNPIYLGALLVQIGYIVWSGSGLLIAYLMFFIAAFHLLIVLFEEPVLQKKFGQEYEVYRRNVPRWLPWFK